MGNEQMSTKETMRNFLREFIDKHAGTIDNEINLDYELPYYVPMKSIHSVIETDLSYMAQMLSNYLLKGINGRKLDERETLELNNLAMEIAHEAICLWEVTERLRKKKMADKSQTTLEYFKN